MGTQNLKVDVALIGGGVAGLWSLNQLRNRGYNAVLFEQDTLGCGQTIDSQGMIHGGLKYALDGSLNGSSESLADMPATWRACLAGKGPVDLTRCEVLSEAFYLWSSGKLTSRLSGFFASKLLRGRITALDPDDYPPPLSNPGFSGSVYQVEDLVLDMPSLLRTLADNHQKAVVGIDWERTQLQTSEGRARLQMPGLSVEPRCLILTAGSGNEALITALGGKGPGMQRRPLQQVIVQHEYPEPLFGHCIGTGSSPRLTVSSHRTRAGQPVWYLGGNLATGGAGESAERLIDRARAELRSLMPWIDLGETRWSTISLDRAEPRQSSLVRPDNAFVAPVEGVENALVAWPTKLTLAPQLANVVQEILRDRAISPGGEADLSALSHLSRPEVAEPCWEGMFR